MPILNYYYLNISHGRRINNAHIKKYVSNILYNNKCVPLCTVAYRFAYRFAYCFAYRFAYRFEYRFAYRLSTVCLPFASRLMWDITMIEILIYRFNSNITIMPFKSCYKVHSFHTACTGSDLLIGGA